MKQNWKQSVESLECQPSGAGTSGPTPLELESDSDKHVVTAGVLEAAGRRKGGGGRAHVGSDKW